MQLTCHCTAVSLSFSIVTVPCNVLSRLSQQFTSRITSAFQALPSQETTPCLPVRCRTGCHGDHVPKKLSVFIHSLWFHVSFLMFFISSLFFPFFRFFHGWDLNKNISGFFKCLLKCILYLTPAPLLSKQKHVPPLRANLHDFVPTYASVGQKK